MKHNEFEILKYLAAHRGGKPSQRYIAESTAISLGSVNSTLSKLIREHFVDTEYKLTGEGYEALAPYRVKNAIILAAGTSSRFVPISYEMPKGLLEVRGEILIERQIRQLQQAGIRDIYVVVGYMMEQFFYLEDKYGVTIIVNSSYMSRNNNGSLYVARSFLGNSYICSSDNYLMTNVFEPYVYDSYYASVYYDHESTEAYVNLDRNDRILSVFHGGKDHWALLGHAYLSSAFCEEYVKHLLAVYDLPETKSMYWEQIFYPYLKEMEIHIRRYPADVIYEFDSIDELRSFDSQFIKNVDSSIMVNISEELHCRISDIVDIHPITNGQTNTSFAFSVLGNQYVYRHPGDLTDKFINRKAESFSCEKARALDLDNSLIYFDDNTGYKISHYIPVTRSFDFCDSQDIQRGLEMLHRLHDARIISPYEFNYTEQIEKIYHSMNATARKRIREFEPLKRDILRLHDSITQDGWQRCLCHGDIQANNFLINGNHYTLIDWEYSGNNDIGYDISRFCSKIQNAGKLTKENVSLYFGRPVTRRQYRHVMACFAVAEFYWFVWAVNLASIHKPVEDVIFTCYRNAKKYCREALALYSD